MMAASRFAGFPDIPTLPNQPSSCFAFPKRPFGKQNRSSVSTLVVHSVETDSFTMIRRMIQFVFNNSFVF